MVTHRDSHGICAVDLTKRAEWDPTWRIVMPCPASLVKVTIAHPLDVQNLLVHDYDGDFQHPCEFTGEQFSVFFVN